MHCFVQISDQTIRLTLQPFQIAQFLKFQKAPKTPFSRSSPNFENLHDRVSGNLREIKEIPRDVHDMFGDIVNNMIKFTRFSSASIN
jgi:hypothetical protein